MRFNPLRPLCYREFRKFPLLETTLPVRGDPLSSTVIAAAEEAAQRRGKGRGALAAAPWRPGGGALRRDDTEMRSKPRQPALQRPGAARSWAWRGVAARRPAATAAAGQRAPPWRLPWRLSWRLPWRPARAAGIATRPARRARPAYLAVSSVSPRGRPDRAVEARFQVNVACG